jgi:mercuric transport protein
MFRQAVVLAAMLWSGLVVAAAPTRVAFDVKNVTCPACSITIEKALDRVPGVTATHVDVEKAVVTVEFDAERTSAPAVAKAISEAGFPASARPAGG